MIRVGTLLFGYCGGAFGRDSYDIKRVEAIGADWIVAHGQSGSGDPVFYQGRPEDLEEHTEPEYDPPGADG